jgi:drug/metabolite transporter (DMT)-like permease
MIDRSTLLLVVTTVGLWGATWVVLKAGVGRMAPGGLACWRHLVAALVFALVALVKRPPRLQRGDGWRLLAAGLVGVAGYNLLCVFGQRAVSAGTAAVIIQTAPVWTTLGAWLVWREATGWGVWVGMIAALVGVALLGNTTGGWTWAVLMLFAASLCFSVYNLLIRPLVARLGAWWTTGWTVWIGTVALLPWVGEGWRDLRDQGLVAWGLVLFLGVLSTVVAYATWGALLHRLPAAKASVFLYLVPVIALLLGWAALGDRPTASEMMGATIILAGVAVAQATGRRSRPAVAAEPG